MTRAASTGLTLPLNEAKASLLDCRGNLIEFEEQKDGSFKSKQVEGDSYTYSYDLTPDPVMVTVNVTKTKKGESSKKAPPAITVKKASPEQEKAFKDAKTIAEFAPDARTKKEAQKYAAAVGRK